MVTNHISAFNFVLEVETLKFAVLWHHNHKHDPTETYVDKLHALRWT